MIKNLENLENKNKGLKMIAGSLAFLLLAVIFYFTTNKDKDIVKTSLTKEKVENIIKNNILRSDVIKDFKLIRFDAEKVEKFFSAEMDIKGEKTEFYIDSKGENIILKNGNDTINIAKIKKAKEIAEMPIIKKIELSEINLKKVSSEEDKILGSKNAEVFIVEYSDLECPFCKRFNATFKETEKKYKGNDKVAFVFRNFPLDKLHPTARKEAEAVQCAFDVSGSEKSFELKNAIFEASKSNGKFNLRTIPSIAEKIGINKVKFEKCIASDEVKKEVQFDYDGGVLAGVAGTPSVFIQTKDGKSIKIASDSKIIESAIEELIK